MEGEWCEASGVFPAGARFPLVGWTPQKGVVAVPHTGFGVSRLSAVQAVSASTLVET